jgi:2-deoxy-D-gluconate 3-dehydrogenase
MAALTKAKQQQIPGPLLYHNSKRDMSNTKAEECVGELGRKARIHTADLSSQDGVSSLTKNILGGSNDASILLNCAAIRRRHPCHLVSKKDWDEVSQILVYSLFRLGDLELTRHDVGISVLQVDLSTVFTICRDIGAYIPTRKPNSSGHRGSIINMASLVSLQGGLTVPAYAAAKGGVTQLTKALSDECASKGVNVKRTAPGYRGSRGGTCVPTKACW